MTIVKTNQSVQSHLRRMESIVEDVEDQRQTEGSPANTQNCKNLERMDVLKPSSGVDQSDCCFTRQLHDYKDSQARY